MEDFKSAKAENDEVLGEIRKVPWVESSLHLTNAIMGRTSNVKSQKMRSLNNQVLYSVFERLFSSRAPPSNTNIMIMSPLTGFVYPLLKHGSRVRWISTGLSVTLTDIQLSQNEYPEKFDYVVKHLGETATESDD